jgi:hypothetical protein
VSVPGFQARFLSREISIDPLFYLWNEDEIGLYAVLHGGLHRKFWTSSWLKAPRNSIEEESYELLDEASQQ